MLRHASLLATLLLLALCPTVLATGDPELPPDEVGATLGPCVVSQTFMVDNSFTTLRCEAAGQELVHHRSGSGFGGWTCVTRVAGTTVQDCGDGGS